MSNYAQEARWLICYHICYCSKASVPWDDVTVPSGDSKSLWEYSHFLPWLVLTACSQWLLHRSYLITRQHLDNHRAICRNLCWAQRDWGAGCRGSGVWVQGWHSSKGSSGTAWISACLTRVLILSAFNSVLSLSLNSVPLSLQIVSVFTQGVTRSALVFFPQTDGGCQ